MLNPATYFQIHVDSSRAAPIVEVKIAAAAATAATTDSVAATDAQSFR